MEVDGELSNDDYMPDTEALEHFFPDGCETKTPTEDIKSLSLEEYGRTHGNCNRAIVSLRSGIRGKARGRSRNTPGFFSRADPSVSSPRNGGADPQHVAGHHGADNRSFFQKFGQKDASEIPHYDDLDAVEYSPIERPRALLHSPPSAAVTVVFGNLGPQVRIIDIEQLCTVYGPVSRCELLSDNGVFTGCAEVDFVDKTAADKAVRAYADKKLDFRPLVCYIKSEGNIPRKSVFQRVGPQRSADRKSGSFPQKSATGRTHNQSRKGNNQGQFNRDQSRSARPFLEKKKKSWGQAVSAEALDRELDLYRASGNSAA